MGSWNFGSHRSVGRWWKAESGASGRNRQPETGSWGFVLSQSLLCLSWSVYLLATHSPNHSTLPKRAGSSNYGLQSLKLWTKINPPPCSCLVSSPVTGTKSLTEGLHTDESREFTVGQRNLEGDGFPSPYCPPSLSFFSRMIIPDLGQHLLKKLKFPPSLKIPWQDKNKSVAFLTVAHCSSSLDDTVQGVSHPGQLGLCLLSVFLMDILPTTTTTHWWRTHHGSSRNSSSDISLFC